MANNDSRQARRVRCPMTVRASAGPLDGHVQSLSTTGMLLVSKRSHPVGQSVRVEFELPDGTPVEAMGEVARVTRVDDGFQGMGIRFVRLNREGARGIERLTNAFVSPVEGRA